MSKLKIHPNKIKVNCPSDFNFSTPILRTPIERFSGLENWNFPEKTIDTLSGFSGLKLNYIDAGSPTRRRTALCLHGQRTWSYAFRKTIPYLLRDSYRVIAPDFYGFGKSDKLIADQAYNFEFHRNTILSLIDALGLENITVVGFGWGAWLGATLPLDIPEKIQDLLLGNTILPEGGYESWPGFNLWKSIHNANLNPSVGVNLNEENELSPEEIAAYDAPFPGAEYKAGIRRFPNLIPVNDVDPVAVKTSKAIAHLKAKWDGNCVCVAGMKDHRSGHRAMSKLQSNINNAAKLIKVENTGSLVFEHADDFMPKALELLR